MAPDIRSHARAPSRNDDPGHILGYPGARSDTEMAGLFIVNGLEINWYTLSLRQLYPMFFLTFVSPVQISSFYVFQLLIK